MADARPEEEYNPFEHRQVEHPTTTRPEEEYNPFEHRQVEHPTTDWETLAHLLKGSLGTGILAIPLAIHYAGLWFGACATLGTGAVLVYCVYLVVRNSQRLCARHQVPQLAYDEVGAIALAEGPQRLRRFAKTIKYSTNVFLVVDLFGCCVVYTIFCAKNLKQVIDVYTSHHFTDREYILMLLPFLLLYILIRPLKILAPLSMVANVLIVVGMLTTLYYVFTDLPPIADRPVFGHVENYPLFFGIAIFSLEGIGVVMPLENNMKNPQHFISGPGILFIGFSIVCVLYAVIGFVGYWKYGDDIKGSITLNLPQKEIPSQAVKVLFAVAMFQTYGLQFYVSFSIIWRNYQDRFGKWNLLVEYALRYAIVTVTVLLAFAVPSIGSVMSLFGCICLSFLGIIFPAVIDFCVCYEEPGLGCCRWRLIVDVALFVFGVVGFGFGTVSSVRDIIDDFCVPDKRSICPIRI